MIILHSTEKIIRCLERNYYFSKYYKFLNHSEDWSIDRLKEYQNESFKSLIVYAFNNVKFYNDFLNKHGYSLNQIQSLEDITKLPLIDKNLYIEKKDDFISSEFNSKKLHKAHTSGTTGKPLQFYLSTEELMFERAAIFHQWRRIGVNRKSKIAQLRGSKIDKGFEYSRNKKKLRLSPVFIKKSTVIQYLGLLKIYQADFLHGYPSVIAHFCKLINNYGLDMPFKLKGVLLASEKEFAWQRNLIKETFQCRVYSHYGQAEHVCLAGQLKDDENYYAIPQYGFAEVDNDTNELIGTSLFIRTNPFIRYKTHDFVIISDNKRNHNYFPVFSSIEGRLEDMITQPDGAIVSPAVLTHPLKDFIAFNNMQFKQSSQNELTVYVEKLNYISDEVLHSEIDTLHIYLRSLFSNEVNINIEIVENIPKTSNGKFKWIISDV